MNDNNLYYLNILELLGNGDISEIDINDDDNSRDLLEQLNDALDDDYYKNITNDSTGNSITTSNDCLPVVTPERHTMGTTSI